MRHKVREDGRGNNTNERMVRSDRPGQYPFTDWVYLPNQGLPIAICRNQSLPIWGKGEARYRMMIFKTGDERAGGKVAQQHVAIVKADCQLGTVAVQRHRIDVCRKLVPRDRFEADEISEAGHCLLAEMVNI